MRKLIFIKHQYKIKGEYKNWQNCEITNGTKNFKIDSFWSKILVFQIEKILEICKFSNLDRSTNLQFGTIR